MSNEEGDSQSEQRDRLGRPAASDPTGGPKQTEPKAAGALLPMDRRSAAVLAGATAVVVVALALLLGVVFGLGGDSEQAGDSPDPASTGGDGADPETVEVHTGDDTGNDPEDVEPEEFTNVVFISIDDLRMFDGVIAHPQAITPNIDRLLAEGMWFPNATSDSMICGPSRVSMLYGLRPTSTGIDSHNATEMDYLNPIGGYFTRQDSVAQLNYGADIASITSLFEQFDAADYYVGYAGKVAHSPAHSDFIAARDVFDTYHPQDHSRIQPLNRPVHGYDDIAGAKNSRTDWGVLSAMTPSNQSEPYVESDTNNHIIKSQALEMLDEADGGPFFISLGFTKPHLPLYVPDRFEAMYRPENLGADILTVELVEDDRLDLAVPRQTKSAIQRVLFDDADRTQSLYRHYLAAVTQVDEYVGEILDKLEELGLDETTNVVLWSDHGYHMGEKQRLGKSLPYWVTTNIPLIIKAPGVTTPGSTTDALVNSVDLFPTLLDLHGLDQPEDFQRDGRSLMRLLSDPDALWPFAATASYAGVNEPLSNTVIHDRDGMSYLEYQHTMSATTVQRELYDLNEDPDQLINLLSEFGGQYSQPHESAAGLLRAQMAGQSLPQAAPAVQAMSIDVDPASPTVIVPVASDPNRDALLISFPGLPSSGRLFTSVEGRPGEPIDSTTLLDGASVLTEGVLYVADDPESQTADDLIVAVSDGIDVVQASIELLVRVNTDGDAVPDHIEDAGPNGGDGNGDGILDSEQSNVTTFLNPVTGGYHTAAIDLGRCMTISEVTFQPSPGRQIAPDPDQSSDQFTDQATDLVADMVGGIIDLQIDCRQSGSGRAGTDVAFYLDRVYPVEEYAWFYLDGEAGLFSEAVDAEFSIDSLVSGGTVGGSRTVVTYAVVDDRPTDTDGQRNGSILHRSALVKADG